MDVSVVYKIRGYRSDDNLTHSLSSLELKNTFELLYGIYYTSILHVMSRRFDIYVPNEPFCIHCFRGRWSVISHSEILVHPSKPFWRCTKERMRCVYFCHQPKFPNNESGMTGIVSHSPIELFQCAILREDNTGIPISLITRRLS